MPKLRVATFNVSMEADNYRTMASAGAQQNTDQREVIARLATGREPQMANVAEIIQRTRPDILFLTEFDYISDPQHGVLAFCRNYLQRSQGGQPAIDYPYYFYAPVNAGQPSPFDLNRDGRASGTGPDAWGFGRYPGQYGMLVLSKYPIDLPAVRTFARFRWCDMPGYANVTTAQGEPWYSEAAWAQFPLSSKSHWDVPVCIGDHRVHILASHPTPPVFDGPEGRNRQRNHDEIRFWQDYVEGQDYLYDDNMRYGGLQPRTAFVIVGDLNACANEGDARREGIASLLGSDQVQGDIAPQSTGALVHSQQLIATGQRDPNIVASHTASWRMRADYVLPSKHGLEMLDSGVFWPAPDEDGAYLVRSRTDSSDHRLVWVDMLLTSPDN